MPSTSRFGLTLGDNLSDHDKTLVDSVLAAFELHDHSGGTQLPDPSGPATGVMYLNGGSLPAGVTYYYRVAYVDRYGLETAASAEVSFTTPQPVANPGVPAVTTATGTAGTLSAGVYYYAITGVDLSGNETLLSTPVTATLIADAGTITLTAPDFPAGAFSYNIWRKGPRTASFSLIGSLSDPYYAFVDTGTVPDDPYAVDPSRLPPAVNRTHATSMLTLQPPDTALIAITAGPVKAWRLYRTTVSGNYPANALLTEVATTVNQDGTGGLLPTFVDDGTTSLVVGKPQDLSQTLHPTVKIVGRGVASAVTLSSPSDNWRLLASTAGTLVTARSAGRLGDGGIFLGSPGGSIYEVNIDDSGALSTSATTPGAGDTVYLDGSGPLLSTPEPTLSYQLGIRDDGVLVTTAIGAVPPPGSDPNGLVANVQTADYTLTAADAGKVIEMDSAGPTTVTIPANATIALPVGAVLEVVNVNTGLVTLAGEAGVTLQSSGGRTTLASQYDGASLRQRAADVWILTGTLS